MDKVHIIFVEIVWGLNVISASKEEEKKCLSSEISATDDTFSQVARRKEWSADGHKCRRVAECS